MKDILITVMMLILVVFLFTNVMGGSDGLRGDIQTQGGTASTNITSLAP
ncbi:hypothetical protein [Marinicrinis sediminis]|uniref:Protein-export membrane protein SecG n=1 Tax=Marinicrinis sediminis TaxID=1652465 RepID=A0ABW5RBW0_9BACL